MSLSTRNIYNESSLTVDSINTDTIQSVNRIFENAFPAAVSSTTSPFSPYTLDYSLGEVFYIPTDQTNTTGNFNIIITNMPTDKSKVYNITLLYYQPASSYYANGLRVLDNLGNYLLGTSSTWAPSLYSGGVPAGTASPNLMVQKFTLLPIADSLGNITQYCISSLSANF